MAVEVRKPVKGHDAEPARQTFTAKPQKNFNFKAAGEKISKRYPRILAHLAK